VPNLPQNAYVIMMLDNDAIFSPFFLEKTSQVLSKLPSNKPGLLGLVYALIYINRSGMKVHF